MEAAEEEEEGEGGEAGGAEEEEEEEEGGELEGLEEVRAGQRLTWPASLAALRGAARHAGCHGMCTRYHLIHHLPRPSQGLRPARFLPFFCSLPQRQTSCGPPNWRPRLMTWHSPSAPPSACVPQPRRPLPQAGAHWSRWVGRVGC